MKIQVLGNFTGTGEVKDFEFTQISSTTRAYLYKVVVDGARIHYEVFHAKKVPICIDFENRIYSETDFKHVYPKAKDFGNWAWVYKSLEKAEQKFNELK